jgi:hypothetical protein
VEETSSFLKSLLASHGPDYLEKLFGFKEGFPLKDCKLLWTADLAVLLVSTASAAYMGISHK